jgi:hypothetical protein
MPESMYEKCVLRLIVINKSYQKYIKGLYHAHKSEVTLSN